MTTIYYENDGDLSELEGRSLAVVGYGNQGRSWALILRDSGLDVRVCVRADATRADAARGDGVHRARSVSYSIPCSASQRSARIAAAHPLPAAVIACRYT